MKDRSPRLNSLLREVLSEVIMREIKDPRVKGIITVTNVDISKDLHHAKVLISVIGTKEDKEKTLEALMSAAGFIAVQASKKVVMRYFPTLVFKLDNSVDQQMKIDALLGEIHNEKQHRHSGASPTE